MPCGSDLTFHQATAAELAGWARGHWIIENSVHWIRDVTFAEISLAVYRRKGRPARGRLENANVSRPR